MDGSDLDEAVSTKVNIHAITQKSDTPKLKLELSMAFEDVTRFKEALCKYVIAHRIEFRFTNNAQIVVRACCAGPSCPWSISASLITENQTFQMREYISKHMQSCI